MTQRVHANVVPVVLGFLITLAAMSSARAVDAPLYDFESGADGWISPQPDSTISINQTEAKVGQASLEWSYNPNGDDASLVRPAPGLKNGPGTVEFWLKCNADACFQLFLEQNAVQYVYPLRVRADNWQHVRVSLSDLCIGKNHDPGGLDLEKVNGIVLMDSSRFHADSNPTARKTWVDGFTFNSESVPQRRLTRTVDGKQEVVFDDFDLDSVGWETTTSVRAMTSKVDGRSVLRLEYKQGKTAVRQLTLSDHIDDRYGQMKALKLVLRSRRPATMVAIFREDDGTYEGPDYGATIRLEGGKEWQTVLLPLKQFEARPGKADPKRRLAMDKSWLFVIQEEPQGDVTVDNTVEIDNVDALLEE